MVDELEGVVEGACDDMIGEREGVLEGAYYNDMEVWPLTGLITRRLVHC
jgi:hypothetical protein